VKKNRDNLGAVRGPRPRTAGRQQLLAARAAERDGR
jgi:hypothetical protein